MGHDTAASVIREARLRGGLSQRGLAERAGIPQSAVSAYESGRTEPSVPVLRRLVSAAGYSLSLQLEKSTELVLPAFVGPIGRRVQRRRDELRALLASGRFDSPQVFGSVARGEDREGSDLDLLVDLPSDAGLFALGAMQREAESLIGAPVDIVPRDGLKPSVAQHITPDLVPL